MRDDNLSVSYSMIKDTQGEIFTRKKSKMSSLYSSDQCPPHWNPGSDFDLTYCQSVGPLSLKLFVLLQFTTFTTNTDWLFLNLVLTITTTTATTATNSNTDFFYYYCYYTLPLILLLPLFYYNSQCWSDTSAETTNTTCTTIHTSSIWLTLWLAPSIIM